MVDRGGAERVGGADIDFFTVVFQLRSQLADRGRFAGPVDADHHDHVRHTVAFLVGEVLLAGAFVLFEQGRDFGAQDAVQFRGVHVFVFGDPFFDPFDDPYGGVDADIRRDQHLFEVVQHLFVDFRLAGHGPRQFRENPFFRLFEPFVEVFFMLLF